MPVDPCFSELLSDPRNTVRPPPAHVPMEKVRQAADRAMAQGESPVMASVRDADFAVEGRAIPVRQYRPIEAERLPAIVFCHGGGFVWGSIETHDGLCRRLAAKTGASVFSVGYRLAPETRFPGPVLDVLGVLGAVHECADGEDIDPDALALCGDSAGGAICVSVAALAAQSGLSLRHLGLFYPALDPSCNTPSQHAFAEGPLLTKSAMEWFWSCYLGPGKPPENVPLPGDLRDLSGLPPTTIATAEFDVLRDEGVHFAKRLTDAGIDTELTCHPGMIHGFLSLPATSHQIDAALDGMCQRLRAAFKPGREGADRF
ncbi:alpha/beta hydrolase [Ruegeria marina]|uniref:Acetyl esterase n=1 Tax=Ruegeria marina TaxID=639004 RepID=A0A1G6VHY5_9RHOB|nr:alpha/beta hydrolase [Ruegeria marina]SDD53134.1 acetyl esterase [Ruegeria marina]